MSGPTTTRTASDALGDAIGYLGWLLDRKRDERGLSSGDLAELRRMDPTGATLPSAFWRVLAIPKVAAAVGENDNEVFERAFAVMVQAMTEIAAVGNETVGNKLAKSGYAEQRFVRLLRARGLREVAYEARLVAQWCHSRSIGLRYDDHQSPNGFGPFILDAVCRRAFADRRAHAIARDYFHQSARDERDATASEPTA